MKKSSVEKEGDFPVDNLTYDLIAIIHEKSKALEAYHKYVEDAQEHDEILTTLEEIRRQDEECVGELQRHLTQLLNAPRTTSRESTSAASASQGQSGATGRKSATDRR